MLVRSRALSTARIVPRLYFSRFNDDAIAGTTTPELLVKLGLINHPKAGLVNWLPVGLAMVHKLRNLIARRMDEAGAEECRMSILSHETLWRKTGRWNGTELFKLTDSGDQNYCLTPTNEEDITNLMRLNLNSYKDLPVTYYQINEKFRDEKRPRMGLLRSKQFLMKDAYSFDLTENDALVSYDNMVACYHRIFDDLRIPYVKALADSGDIGGSLSHEWHYMNKAGEDTLFTCDHCHATSNVEKTLSLPVSTPTSAAAEVETKYFVTESAEFLRVLYPKNREFQVKFLELEYPNAREVEQKDVSGEHLDTVSDSRVAFDGPTMPLVAAEENEVCHSCKKGHLKKDRAIEVGHTFYLGTKYSKPLGLTVAVPENDKLVTKDVLMGCYGIGLSRIIAAIAEINRDEHGFRWPRSIAPWDVTVVEAGKLDETHRQTFYEHLNKNNIDYRADTRNTNLNKKIKQSNMLGIPMLVILGKKFPFVEIEIRGKVYCEPSWRQQYRQHHESYRWTYDEASTTRPQKHRVAVEHLGAVVQALLKDM